MNNRTRALIASAAAAAVVLTGCSTKGGGGVESKTDSSGVKTDFGVTDKTITLGAISDASGAYKVTGTSLTYGNQLWADEVNASGGICGRDIKIEVRDHGYTTDKAVTLYAEVQPKMLGMVQLVGSPMLAALKSQIKSDNVITMPGSWASSNLDTEQVFMVGSTYDIEIMNGMAYLQDQKMIKDGDTVGAIVLDSEAGANTLAGVQYYADKHNIKVESVKMAATDNDLSSAVTSMKSKGVNAIALILGPKATSSVTTQMQAQGLDVPVVANAVSFDPTLLDTPAASSFGKFYRVASVVPYSSDNPLMAKIRKEYAAKYTDKANDSVTMGYIFGTIWGKILDQACKDKDLTRAGLMKAKNKIKIDTQGLTGKLDFSEAGNVSSRLSLIETPDAASEGGLKLVQDLTESKEAKSYKTPYQK
ncbi:ABC-type branched-subunit amino acid transport system substrate-binding protein [Antricoccus suffuscus]|uniref:ABC-type branched-subunit amino acid transport system substrate-binding protein n=1 Tax=Antricoccus suffuscus TaxID=1629062 RepID=A0A2T1A362_9ACTN|nr:ABC transporter substrate-binding protein [Antricoccus suffuscus]PRZ43026.1 ABC-type branched-subunit amino acid transport system substrate-binding protein [Antricoccus suffuscus]